MTDTKGIVLVTGANRGIGLEVCRQLAELNYTVLLGSRDLAKGEAAAAGIQSNQRGALLDVRAIQLDVTDRGSIDQVSQRIEREFGRLDVLINNAAVLYDYGEHILTADLENFHKALETNTFGILSMCRAFAPLIRKSAHGRIVNVSSEAGSLASMGDSSPAYNLSKTALNAVTRMVADALRKDRVLVNSICPGWVATDMGGSGGRPIPDGAASVVWAVTIPDDGPTGGFFRDGKPLAW